MKVKMKKNIGIVVLIVIVCVAIIKSGTSLAYFFADKGHETSYQLAKIDTEIDEDFQQITQQLYTKNPKVKNIGDSDAIVRVRIEITPSSQKDNLEFIDQDNQSQWKQEDDGYYYYQNVLKAGEETDTLFDQVKIKDIEKMEDFDIIVYHEAIQTIVYDEKGNSISSVENNQYQHMKALEVWKYYQ